MKGKQLLIVDDTALLLESIAELFAMEGFEVATAENGQEALDRLAEVRPDLIITDLIMPVMDGFGLIRNVRAHPEWNGVPILVFSARPEKEHEAVLADIGATAFVMKPCSYDILLEAVRKILA